MDRFSELTIDETKEPQMEWGPLTEVDDVPMEQPITSNQRPVRAERETVTLRASYSSPDKIPDTVAEAKLELPRRQDIPVKPTEDLTGNTESVRDFRLVPGVNSTLLVASHAIPTCRYSIRKKGCILRDV